MSHKRIHNIQNLKGINLKGKVMFGSAATKQNGSCATLNNV